MKKKVIFMIINMNVGGTEKALLNMIEEMPHDKYDITILMLEKYGGFLNSIPKRVQTKYLDGYSEIKEILNQSPQFIFKKYMKKDSINNRTYFLLVFLMSKLLQDKRILFKYLLKNTTDFITEYDIAVAYAGPMDFISYFVAEKIKAKRKIQWIHFDITKIGFDKKFANKVYQNFQRVYVVSEEAKTKFVDQFPKLKNRTNVFFNIVSPRLIKYESVKGNGFKNDFNGVRIATVGRLTEEKGQDIAIKVLAKLKKSGYNIRWYCIGEGVARHKYEQLIHQYKLKDSFILLGQKQNPFPYIDQCDIYVQPSRYEGYCLTVMEAMSLNKPVITTNVNGANEQIEHEVTGLITNINVTELTQAIKRLVDNEWERKFFENNLIKHQESALDEDNKERFIHSVF